MISPALLEDDIAYAAQAVQEACLVYRRALGDAIVAHLRGQPVRLAPRQFT